MCFFKYHKLDIYDHQELILINNSFRTQRRYRPHCSSAIYIPQKKPDTFICLNASSEALVKFAFNSVSFEDFLVFDMRKSRKLSLGNMFLSSLYVTTVILLIPYRFCKWSQCIVKRKKRHERCSTLCDPPLPTQTTAFLSFSLSFSLCPHSRLCLS